MTEENAITERPKRRSDTLPLNTLVAVALYKRVKLTAGQLGVRMSDIVTNALNAYFSKQDQVSERPVPPELVEWWYNPKLPSLRNAVAEILGVKPPQKS